MTNVFFWVPGVEIAREKKECKEMRRYRSSPVDLLLEPFCYTKGGVENGGCAAVPATKVTVQSSTKEMDRIIKMNIVISISEFDNN